ncbi:hypothetical protein CAQU_11660 [Corynebacterium aquilae DSM 44791]|uniref:EcsC family protein n=1 Tax=Corynebacterium aquilae DSM 44791 TaxID=1431546 RepID=A0A1L7CIE3_9CORY|nr:hypothetical protein CAQU_11660 [Corynebacterium aquilae DSM 44791]
MAAIISDDKIDEVIAEELNGEFEEEINGEPIDRSELKNQLAQVKEFVSTSSMADFKSGDWFKKLLTQSVANYTKQVDAEFFRKKYPNLPTDEIVNTRIALASRYAAIEGGLTSSAYTGAIATTIQSAGSASPVAVPAAASAFLIDMVFLTQIQMRLAYDISVLYGKPLDINDSEDSWKLIRIAFGVKGAEVGGNVAMKGVPAVVQHAIRAIFSGARLKAAQALPVIGKKLLQRNLVKMAIPGVGVPVAIALNGWMTRAVGYHAKTVIRDEVRVAELADRIMKRSTEYEAVLWSVLWAARRVGRLSERQSMFIHYLSIAAETEAKQAGHKVDFEEFRTVVEIDEEKMEQVIRDARGEGELIYGAVVQALGMREKITKKAITVLSDFANKLDVAFDLEEAEAVAKSWK